MHRSSDRWYKIQKTHKKNNNTAGKIVDRIRQTKKWTGYYIHYNIIYKRDRGRERDIQREKQAEIQDKVRSWNEK